MTMALGELPLKSTGFHQWRAVSGSFFYYVKLKPAYTTSLEETLWIISPTYALQETPVISAMAFKWPLPLRAIVQVSISMAGFVSRCDCLNLLDGAVRRGLDELVISMLGPIDREAYDDKRLVSAVLQA